MSKFHEKAEAQTKQIIGQMLGDELLVQEGKKQQKEATESRSSDGGHDQGIVRDERGQEQPADKERAQRVSRVTAAATRRESKQKRKGRPPPNARGQLADSRSGFSSTGKKRGGP